MGKKNLINILYVVIFALAAAVFAYQKGWVLADFDSISPQEASMLSKQDNTVTILDVRTPEEYAAGHIASAILIPLGTLSSSLQKLDGAKDKKIIVYCKSGNRSVAASRILKEHGFHPINVKSGFDGWVSDGLPVER